MQAFAEAHNAADVVRKAQEAAKHATRPRMCPLEGDACHLLNLTQSTPVLTDTLHPYQANVSVRTLVVWNV